MFKYKEFKRRHPDSNIINNEQWLFKFENGYGASVIIGTTSYGGDEGLYELAVIKWYNKEDWDIVYDTEITGDVLGWLTVENVNNLLEKIRGLL